MLDDKPVETFFSFEKAASQNQMIKSFGESISTIAILQVEGEDDFSFPLGKVLKYLEFGKAENLKLFAQALIFKESK